MLNNISLSSYKDQNSIIHKLNPLTKILLTLIFSLFTFIQNELSISILLLLMVIITLFLSHITVLIFYKMAKSCKYLIVFLLIINIINGFSIENYIVNVLKLLLVMVDANILITTTTLVDINYGLYQLLKPLCIFNKTLPSKVSFTLTLSIRFIPTLLDEASKIIKAQKSRGINIKEISYRNKIKVISAFLKQLFINTIRKADELADNMELREYDISNYQAYETPKRFSFIDYFLITSYTIILICIIIRGVLL